MSRGEPVLAGKLLEALRRSGNPCTTLELAKAVGLRTRKEVNPTLYALRDQRKVRLVTNQPPTWQLASTTTEGPAPGLRRAVSAPQGRSQWCPSPPAPRVGFDGRGQSEPVRSRPPPTRTPPASGPTQFGVAGPTRLSNLHDDDQVTSQVVQVLRNSPSPQTALEISKAIGTNRKTANQVLYRMEGAGIVTKTEGSGPPRWSLTSQREDDFISNRPLVHHHQPQLFMQRSSEGGAHQSPRTTHNPPSNDSPAFDPGDIDYDDMPPLITDGSPMDTTSPSFGGETSAETCGTSPYASSGSVDLSTIAPGDIQSRILAVMHSEESFVRTDLELAKAIGEGYTRSQVRPCLEDLARKGQVKVLPTMPPKWCLATTTPGPVQPAQVSVTALPSNWSSNTLANITEMNRNPVSALSEHCQAIKTDLTFVEVREFGPPHRKHFVIAARFGKHSFEAESTNKKEAKRMAADLALQAIRANQASVAPAMQTGQPFNPGPGVGVPRPSGPQSNRFADRIASMSHNFYLQIQRTIDTPQPGRKVIAAFIMEDTSSQQMSVVSVGSGTRCITGDHMSLEGLVVNDSHAEVVARRSLLRFFYHQLSVYHSSNEETIFAKSPRESILAEVRDGISFHLYISTAPCGDGAQFSRGDEVNRDPPPVPVHKPTMLTKSQGVLRTKMEGGEGTIPIADAQPQTWDGIMQGGRLRTMSCSDKVGRWNVLGLQGSLLSNFMKPVYMSSLTLGSLHHHGHLARAVCCRFSDLELPSGFQVNHPTLDRVEGGDEMKRHTEKTSNLSMNWALGDERAELIDGGNGRPVQPPGMLKSQLSTTCSRITKLSLYSRFLDLCQIANRSDLLGSKSYKDAKDMSASFQRAKRSLYKHCENKGYGMWMKKPVEQEQFDSSVLDRVRVNT